MKSVLTLSHQDPFCHVENSHPTAKFSHIKGIRSEKKGEYI